MPAMRIPSLAAVGIFALWAAPALAAGGLGECESMAEPVGAPEYQSAPSAHTLLCRTGYVLSHNDKMKVPDWVLESLTPDRFKKNVGREDRFVPDPKLVLDGRPHAVDKDYLHSGFDRGHMAPAADMTWNKTAMEESFYFSNIAPQVGSGFNQHIWKYLETQVREWTKDRERLIVITGPVYGGSREPIGNNKVTVPKAFYKIVYDPEWGRAIGFLLPNEKLSGKKFKDYRVSIRKIEDATDLDFFPKLSRREQNILERRKSPMWRDFPD